MMLARQPIPLSAIAQDVLEGLTRSPKSLPPKLFYDAEGSALFERITRLPEYYLTRTERAIFARHAPAICRAARRGAQGAGASAPAHAALEVIELGAGSASKTRLLLAALLEQQAGVVYSPVDVSSAALQTARAALEAEFPALRVRPRVADITSDLRPLLRSPQPKLVLFIGSSIGNFEPEAAVALLRGVRRALAPGDALLLGADLVKPESILLPAYDDSAGVTAAFNQNVLARINRELGGRFDLDSFRHEARWNARASRIEIYLVSRVAQSVPIGLLGITVPFARGESIHTENSYKYTSESLREMFTAAGFHAERVWHDRRRWFAVHLARVS
jgi:L-histidine N-alpha-methyltransferase